MAAVSMASRIGACRRNVVVYAFVLFTVTATTVVGKISVKWDRSHVEARQGDNVTIVCTVTELDFLSVIRVEKKDDDKKTTMTISDNDDIKAPFSRLPRYKAQFDMTADIGTVTLKYQGIRGEDAGTLVCGKLSSDPNRHESRLELKVLVPIQSVRLKTVMPNGTEADVATDGGLITLTETSLQSDNPNGRGAGIVCVAAVNGSLTAPNLRVMVDSNDVTRVFVPLEKSRIIEDAPTSGEGADTLGGLGTYYGEKKLTYMTALPDPLWNGRTLSCVAEQEGFPDETASATVIVKYIPQINCSADEVEADLGEAVTLVCIVKASPSGTISWRFGDNTERIDNETGGEDLVISLRTLDADRTEATLRITSLDAARLGTYHISAHNSVGDSAEKVVVKRDKSPVRARDNDGAAINRPKYTQAQTSTNEVAPGSDISSSGMSWSMSSLPLLAISCLAKLSARVNFESPMCMVNSVHGHERQ